ncbi:MAG: nicotinate-nucleotide--dimethylbenzimidazole phosphoribosyltransferase [Motiliproteus sp.]|jgi:nicotinate-nucleotide--dimethylbenzimidazole phosphoribosyltransferase
MKQEWLTDAVSPLNISLRDQARAHQDQLTKPQGSLGQLESIAAQFSAMQGRLRPQLEQVYITVFAADHGVADEGVSAFPQAVTAEMVRNFSRGGAAICVLARQLGASLEVVNLGTIDALEPLPGVIDCRIAPATANFCLGAAMGDTELAQALGVGLEAAERAQQRGAQLFIGGEMGIANTTVATAMAAALLDRPVVGLTGSGTGIDACGVAHKAAVIERALALHRQPLQGPLEVLRCLGGFEIAALVGAYVRCAQLGIPVLVDGFITTAAALTACRINPEVRSWLLFSHNSTEPGHRAQLEALSAETLLDLGLRLGEGSGAALAVPLLRAACALQAQMATFAEAAVSGRD